MAYKKKSDFNILPMETKIEFIATKGEKVFKKVMEYGEALNTKKKKGWVYKYYQIGFSQFSNIENEKI